LKILFVAGLGRSGSTVVGDLLNDFDGLTCVGESRYIPLNGFLLNEKCSCGTHAHQCGFWAQVRARLDKDEVFWKSIHDAQERVNRARNIPSLFCPRIRTRSLRTDIDRCNSAYSQLLSVVQDLTDGTSIVDTTKTPMHARLLCDMPRAKVSILHLVRDSRAVAFSWKRVKARLERNENCFMPRYSAWRTSAYWLASNIVSERLKRVADGYCRIRYEDFVQDPVGVLSDALQSLGFPTTSHGVTESHTIGGNPDRFTSRFKSIIIDNEWQAHHSPIVTGMTWPLLKRYKYPIRQDRNS
jgi:hypothetical protein